MNRHPLYGTKITSSDKKFGIKGFWVMINKDFPDAPVFEVEADDKPPGSSETKGITGYVYFGESRPTNEDVNQLRSDFSPIMIIKVNE